MKSIGHYHFQFQTLLETRSGSSSSSSPFQHPISSLGCGFQTFPRKWWGIKLGDISWVTKSFKNTSIVDGFGFLGDRVSSPFQRCESGSRLGSIFHVRNKAAKANVIGDPPKLISRTQAAGPLKNFFDWDVTRFYADLSGSWLFDGRWRGDSRIKCFGLARAL